MIFVLSYTLREFSVRTGITLKESLFERTEIEGDTFIAKKMELNVRLQNLLNNPESLVSHEQVWQDIDNNTDKKTKSRNRKFR